MARMMRCGFDVLAAVGTLHANRPLVQAVKEQAANYWENDDEGEKPADKLHQQEEGGDENSE